MRLQPRDGRLAGRPGHGDVVAGEGAVPGDPGPALHHVAEDGSVPVIGGVPGHRDAPRGHGGHEHSTGRLRRLCDTLSQVSLYD